MFWVKVHECLIRLLRINKFSINLSLYKERFKKATLLPTKTVICVNYRWLNTPNLLPSSQIILNIKCLQPLGCQQPKFCTVKHVNKVYCNYNDVPEQW